MIVECGYAINYSYFVFLIKVHSFSMASNKFFVHSINPAYPKSRSEPHAELRQPPFLDPRAVGEMYIPPGHVENVKY
jgi:hypothetical protein